MKHNRNTRSNGNGYQTHASITRERERHSTGGAMPSKDQKAKKTAKTAIMEKKEEGGMR